MSLGSAYKYRRPLWPSVVLKRSHSVGFGKPTAAEAFLEEGKSGVILTQQGRSHQPSLIRPAAERPAGSLGWKLQVSEEASTNQTLGEKRSKVSTFDCCLWNCPPSFQCLNQSKYIFELQVH